MNFGLLPDCAYKRDRVYRKAMLVQATVVQTVRS